VRVVLRFNSGRSTLDSSVVNCAIMSALEGTFSK